MSSSNRSEKPMTPLRAMTLRWNAFTDAIMDENVELLAELAKADPVFVLKPPKHLQKSKSTTAQIYNNEPFPLSFAWLWDQTSSHYPELTNPVVVSLLTKAAKLKTPANLEHLVLHYEAKGMDPLGAIHQSVDGGGLLLHISLINAAFVTADWMLARRPDLLDQRDVNGRTANEFLEDRASSVDASSLLGHTATEEDVADAKRFIEVWSRRRVALEALDDIASSGKKAAP